MSPFDAVGLFGAAGLAGAINAVAGGGTLVTFPALTATGVPEIWANTTSSVALWPGAVASVAAYRRELRAQDRKRLIVMSAASLSGGLLGALILLRTSNEGFKQILPFLMLTATLLFAFGSPLTRWIQTRFGDRNRAAAAGLAGVALLQFGIGIYGGYFGAGIGFLMLAALTITGMENIHVMNALKILLNSLINGIAVAAFVIAGRVLWPQAGIMICGAIAGGYLGAHYARQVRPEYVRRLVIAIGLTMTVYYFLNP